MDLTELSAVMGIDLATAPTNKIAERASEFCREMVECYEDGTLERSAFAALWFTIDLMRRKS